MTLIWDTVPGFVCHEISTGSSEVMFVNCVQILHYVVFILSYNRSLK
jgi:hypothetical protein